MGAVSEISRRIGTVALTAVLSINALPQTAEGYSSIVSNSAEITDQVASQYVTYNDLVSFLLNPKNDLDTLSQKLVVTLNNKVQLLKDPNSSPTFLGDINQKVSQYMLINLSDGSMIFIFAPENGTDLSEKPTEQSAIQLERIPITNDLASTFRQNSKFPLIFRGDYKGELKTPTPLSSPTPTPFPIPDCDPRYQYCPTTPIQDVSV